MKNLFNKEKSGFLKLLNAIFVVLILFYLVSFVWQLIEYLLPSHGDYSGFSISSFIYFLLTHLINIGISSATLYLANTKLHLFGKDYALSKNIFNIILFIITPLMLISITNDFLGLIVQYKVIDNKDLALNIVDLIIYLVLIFVINSFDLLKKNNGLGLNILNCITLLIVSSELSSIFSYLFKGSNINDWLYDVITFIVMIITICLFNIKVSENIKTDLPQAFNVDRSC